MDDVTHINDAEEAKREFVDSLDDADAAFGVTLRESEDEPPLIKFLHKGRVVPMASALSAIADEMPVFASILKATFDIREKGFRREGEALVAKIGDDLRGSLAILGTKLKEYDSGIVVGVGNDAEHPTLVSAWGDVNKVSMAIIREMLQDPVFGEAMLRAIDYMKAKHGINN